jgi:hypothetical protein
MVTKSKILKAIAVFISLALLAQPTQALAWGGHDHHDSYHYPQYGRSSWWLPAAFATLAIAGMTYYYSQGVYYRRAPHGYVVVAPPEGAVVTTIPAGFETVNINGANYYTSDGIYYQPVQQGYMVVQQPGVVVQPPAPPAPPAVAVPPQNTPDSFTVNIPNDRGGYTPVVLKRYGSGFTGPQGEFYSSFPSVEQLRLMYGNK